MRNLRPSAWATVFVGTLALIGCGSGGGDGSPTTPAPVTPTITVTTVNVSLPSSTIEIGGTVTATASVLDQNGSTISGKTVTWSSDNDKIATVTSAGVVTGIGNGTVKITGSVDGKQGQATGTVITASKWVIDATVLTNADYGNQVGELADVAVVQLNDGRYRMWLGGTPDAVKGIRSAISVDGIKFTPESGVRIPVTPIPEFPLNGFRLSHPFVMRADDGKIHLFAHGPAAFADSGMAIFSYTSADEGVTFTQDPGKRVTAAEAGMKMFGIVGSKIVKMKSGGWRMYYSSANAGTFVGGAVGFIPGIDLVKSAFSTDLVKWTPDAGVRIGAGSTLTGSAVHPGAIANDDGSITLIYTRFVDGFTFGSYSSTSADGINFTTESLTGFYKPAQATGSVQANPAADPFLMRLPNGDVRMFYNWGDDKVGNVYVAHRRGFTLAGP